MAEEYTIWLRNGTKKKEKAIAGTTGDNQKDNSPNGAGGGAGGKLSAKDVAGYIAYKHYVSPFVKQAVSYQISTVSLKTGRTEHQQRLQFAYDAGSKVVSLVENVAMGFMLSGGNPLGALAGAAVSVVQTAVQYAQAQKTIDLERSAESISIGLQNVRAGGSVASYNSSRGDRR